MKFPTMLRTILFFFAMVVLLACDVSALLPGASARPIALIQSPAQGTTFKEGDEIPVQSTSSDPSGIVRVELLVDGQVVSTDTPPIPQGQVSFSLVQKWKATSGEHTVSVRAYNAAGTGSDPASVTLSIAPAQVAQATSTAAPSPSPQPVASPTGAQPTNTIGAISSQPTATRRPNTPTPSRAPASPTVSAPPGVYAISMRIDPPSPRANQAVTFYVTFLNATGETKHYRWYVKIYRPDERNSFGETARKEEDMPAGRTELASPSNWRVGGFGDCQPYYARPFWFDVENNIPAIEFLKTDGQALNQGFQVCP